MNSIVGQLEQSFSNMNKSQLVDYAVKDYNIQNASSYTAKILIEKMICIELSNMFK